MAVIFISKILKAEVPEKPKIEPTSVTKKKKKNAQQALNAPSNMHHVARSANEEPISSQLALPLLC